MSRRNAFQFKAGNSLFHRLDPMSKLVWLFGVSLLAFGAYIAWIQVVITLAVLGTALFLARLSVSEVVRGTWIFIAASMSFFIIQTLSLPGHTVAFHIFSKPIYAESADYALASALRIYAIVLSSMVFVRTTDPRDLAIALVTQMRMPYRIAYTFFIALRIVPTIEEEIHDHPLGPCGARRCSPAFDLRPDRRDQALCDAAAGRQLAPRFDNGDVDGGARLWRLPHPHLRGIAPNERVRRVALHLHGHRRRRLVRRADAGLRSFRLYFFAGVIAASSSPRLGQSERLRG